MRLSLFVICIALQLTQVQSAAARSYFTPARTARADDPGASCRLRSFYLWGRRDKAIWQVVFYPKKRPQPCRRGQAAKITGWFESFQINGGASKGCYGDFTLYFSPNGRILTIQRFAKGTLRGMSCPHRGINVLILKG